MRQSLSSWVLCHSGAIMSTQRLTASSNLHNKQQVHEGIRLERVQMHDVLYIDSCAGFRALENDHDSMSAETYPHIHIPTCSVVLVSIRCCNICNFNSLFYLRFSWGNCVRCINGFIGNNFGCNALSILKWSKIPRLHARIRIKIPQPKPTHIFIHACLYSLPYRFSSLDTLATQLLFIILYGKYKLLQILQQRIPRYS